MTISVEEFEQIRNQLCSYCGQEAGGIDRIDSQKGYTISNSQPCCTQCNMMKYTYTEQKFLSKVIQICEHRALTDQ